MEPSEKPFSDQKQQMVLFRTMHLYMKNPVFARTIYIGLYLTMLFTVGEPGILPFFPNTTKELVIIEII